MHYKCNNIIINISIYRAYSTVKNTITIIIFTLLQHNV